MKSTAAVVASRGAALTIEQFDLDEPAPREIAVRIASRRHLPHRPPHTRRRVPDPGLPGRPWTRGRRGGHRRRQCGCRGKNGRPRVADLPLLRGVSELRARIDDLLRARLRTVLRRGASRRFLGMATEGRRDAGQRSHLPAVLVRLAHAGRCQLGRDPGPRSAFQSRACLRLRPPPRFPRLRSESDPPHKREGKRTPMPTYTVHQPPPRKGETASAPERFVFVRDGFHFWAFVLAPLWLLRHRLWLAFAIYLVVSVLLGVGLLLIGASIDGAIPCRAADRVADRLRGGDALALEADAARLEDARLRGRRGRRGGGAAILCRVERSAPAKRRRAARRAGAALRRAGAARHAVAVRRDRPVPGAGERAMSVAIVDYGSGNLHSAAKAFERAARESGHDQPIVVTSDPDAGRARRPRGAARRRRLRRLPARARRDPRHDRGAGRERCASRAGRSSASASACS